MRIGIIGSLFAASLTFAPMARALTQPDGAVIPSALGCNAGAPSGLAAVFACACTTPGICNIGAPCPGGSTSCDPGTRGSCETTLWHAPNDNSCIPTNLSGLDPAKEAAITPETFRPTCSLTFTIQSRGTARFRNIFGWYNVTSHAPAAGDLHPMFGCTDAAPTSVVLDLSKEPAYLGGEIGFFLLTPESHASPGSCDGGDCCPTTARFGAGVGWAYFSESKYNPDGGGGAPFIHLLTYASHLSKNKFYFAWEDTYQTKSADFTDLVASVEGVQCTGGGASCDTGKPGACALGVTTCSGGALGCSEAVSPSSEQCNGVDDDCNGAIDDGATCPRAGDVCLDGACVSPCELGEFKCPFGKSCDASLHKCVETACVGVRCPTGQLCRGGACGAPCDGIVCPFGQSCIAGACIDPCASTSCAAGQVCRLGRCFAGCAACDGVACGAGTRCESSSGACVDPSCSAPCGPGTHCSSGACVDDCAGAVCPAGQSCAGGRCVDPASADGDGGLTLGGADAGVGGDASASDASTGGPTASTAGGARHGGCSCAVPGGGSLGDAASARLGSFVACLVVVAVARRRRRNVGSPSFR